MGGLVGLDYRSTGSVTAARPPDRLGDELVRPLGGAFVRQIEGDIGRHDANERDIRDVETLGDHAGTDQDIEAPPGEGVDDSGRRALVGGDVPIEATGSEGGQRGTTLSLDAICAATAVAESR